MKLEAQFLPQAMCGLLGMPRALVESIFSKKAILKGSISENEKVHCEKSYSTLRMTNITICDRQVTEIPQNSFFFFFFFNTLAISIATAQWVEAKLQLRVLMTEHLGKVRHRKLTLSYYFTSDCPKFVKMWELDHKED